MEKCLLCGENRNIERRMQHHHLSYDPEEIVILCRSCHVTLHHFNTLSKRSRILLMEWVLKYGDNWKDGKKKFVKSAYLKEYKREMRKINRKKILEQGREWRKIHPEYAKEYNKKYYEKNSIIIRNKSKEYYDRNKEVVNKKSRERWTKKKEEQYAR